MPVSTFLGLQTALRGVLAQQRALDTTAHNIANANTVGYTRQEALLEATEPYTVPGVTRPPQAGQLGTGVDVDRYRRIRDDFIDTQLRAQTTLRGMHDAVQDGLRQVELVLAEPGETGINTMLARYWAAWHDLSNAPENLATRQALAQSAGALADGFRNLESQLQTIKTQIGQNEVTTIDEVNSIGVQVAALNQSIHDAYVVGDQPNDLLDQRDLLIDRLWELGNVSITAGAYGVLDVTFAGETLVTSFTPSTLAPPASAFTSLTAGKLRGLLDLDAKIDGYLTTLNGIASELITSTNAQHAAGFDLTGSAGGTFFAGTDATNIAIAPAILTNPSLIAAADAWAGAGEPGNADNALAVAGLQTTPLAALGGATVDAAYARLVTTIGSDSREAQRLFGNAEVLANGLENRRQSVSGVSLDEEMTGLIRFQRGYQAAARALSAMDEMIELLVTRTGRVGL
jgi:flagellar hook-associated protein 1 FlgK